MKTPRFVLVVIVLAGCRGDGLLRPTPAPSAAPAIDPALMDRLKAQRFTGTVVGFIDTRTSRGQLMPSRTGRFAAPGGALFDRTSGLLFIVPPGGGKAVQNVSHTVPYALFWQCVIDGVDYGLLRVNVALVKHTAEDGTGGHTGSHAGEKPAGQSQPDHGLTDGDKYFRSTYTSGIVSGDEQLDATWTVDQPGSPCDGMSGVDTYHHATRWTGLFTMTTNGLLIFAQISSHHNNIYYATAGADTKTKKAATAYYKATDSTQKLIVNAASLQFGGLEDVNNNWAPPHSTHRIGTDVDLDGRPGAAGDTPAVWKLVKLAGEKGGGFKRCDIHNKNHLHCYDYLYP